MVNAIANIIKMVHAHGISKVLAMVKVIVVGRALIMASITVQCLTYHVFRMKRIPRRILTSSDAESKPRILIDYQWNLTTGRKEGEQQI